MHGPDDGVTLAILAGGRGRRLGGIPKGLLLREGRPLLSHLLDLRPAFDDVLLVTPDPAPYAAFGLHTVGDVVKARGAPGGVHAALVQARTPWVLAVAADMPFVTGAVVGLLLGKRNSEVDAVGFELAGRLEPLLACYRTALAPAWGRALADGPSFRALWALARARLLDAEALARVDPTGRAGVSVNTPEDARRWSIALPSPGASSE